MIGSTLTRRRRRMVNQNKFVEPWRQKKPSPRPKSWEEPPEGTDYMKLDGEWISRLEHFLREGEKGAPTHD